ncbi:MAG: hypothetical protein NVS2B8_15540 [Vulcanimicrobiaceae bacterium]
MRHFLIDVGMVHGARFEHTIFVRLVFHDRTIRVRLERSKRIARGGDAGGTERRREQ